MIYALVIGFKVMRVILIFKIFKKWGREVWTGLMWLRIGTGGGHL